MNRRFLNYLMVHLHMALFVVLAGAFLMLLLFLAYRHYPRTPDPLASIMGLAQQQPTEPLWKRLLRGGGAPPSQWVPNPGASDAARRRGGAQDQDVKRVGSAPGGVPGISLDPRQLALREIVEAQIILRNQAMQTEKGAWETVKSTPIQGPFRSFEEERFASRVLLMQFLDNQDDMQVLQKLKRQAVKVAGMPGADFEEIYYAGISCLLTGDLDAAIGYLERAESMWPARGRGYANVFMFLTVAYAVKGQDDRTFAMLGQMQEVYPDWLYIETYMPDLDQLEGVYPQAPLVKVIKGYMYRLVLNEARARQEFDRAIDSGRLSSRARRMVMQWLAEPLQIGG